MIYIFSIFYILFSIFVLYRTIPTYIEIIKYSRNKDEKICITILFIAVIVVIITVLNLSIKGMIIG